MLAEAQHTQERLLEGTEELTYIRDQHLLSVVDSRDTSLTLTYKNIVPHPIAQHSHFCG